MPAMISTSSSRPTLRAASNSVRSFSCCSALQFLRIVRMIEAEALDAMVERPFDELRADILAEFESAAASSPAIRPAGRSRRNSWWPHRRRRRGRSARRSACRSRRGRSTTRAAASTASRLKATILSWSTPSSSATLTSCERWSMASAISSGISPLPGRSPSGCG